MRLIGAYKNGLRSDLLSYNVAKFSWGGRVWRAQKREAQAQILDMFQTWQSDLSLGQSHWERKKLREIKKGKKKVTGTQGGTRTHDLANGLPFSNQLSYQVTLQLSGWIWVHNKAELPGIQPKWIPSWHVRWGWVTKEPWILRMYVDWKRGISGV